MADYDPGPAEHHGHSTDGPSGNYVSWKTHPKPDARHDGARLLTPLQTDCRRLGSAAEYSPNLVHSPTEHSDDSMPNSGRATPSQTPPLDVNSPRTPADELAHLSFHQVTGSNDVSSPSPGREQPVLASLKRTLSTEFAGQSAGPLMRDVSTVRPVKNALRRPHRRVPLTSHGPRPSATHDAAPMGMTGTAAYQARLQSKLAHPVPRDSGYESMDSRQNTLQQPGSQPAASRHPSTIPFELMQGQTVQRHNGLIQLPANSRYPGLILQPDSCPISQEQLAAEVKGIYAGLVMVEAKCINMDATQAASPESQLGPGQWQALIALHRTLLYEHHDFLMATQHPSASEALRGLAAKYSMPARMWKHGIHAFLEVLRHRRPDSQDYMLAFIYLAYQMMALLFETVPSFTDTWIECLGDLARYRMAIEEEKEPHATWGGVAARWYVMASDRHPAIGRLYHHLGILERPSLRKMCLYAKSLTCVIPFSNARDSLATLCGPIVQDEEAIRSSENNPEARPVTFYALVYTGKQPSMIEKVSADALKLIRLQHHKLKDSAAYLAYTNVAALFEFGSPTNPLWQVYSHAINQAIQSTRVTENACSPISWPTTSTTIQNTPVLSYGTKFCTACFNSLIRHGDDRAYLFNVLPFSYVMLAFLHSLFMVRKKLLDCGVPLHTFRHIIEPAGFSWIGLADFLNSLARHEPIHPQIPELARQKVFPTTTATQDARPLAEDYLIRGSMWCQFYFVPGWFNGQTEDDGRAIETPRMQRARAERVLWLGLFLAFHTDYIVYDVRTQQFAAASRPPTTSSPMAEVPDTDATHESGEVNVDQRTDDSGPMGRSPHAISTSSQSDDGFAIVKNPPSHPRYTSAPAIKKQAPSIPPPKKQKRKQVNNTVKVFEEDGILIDPDSGYQF